jgi:hypothetical protein
MDKNNENQLVIWNKILGFKQFECIRHINALKEENFVGKTKSELYDLMKELQNKFFTFPQGCGMTKLNISDDKEVLYIHEELLAMGNVQQQLKNLPGFLNPKITYYKNDRKGASTKQVIMYPFKEEVLDELKNIWDAKKDAYYPKINSTNIIDKFPVILTKKLIIVNPFPACKDYMRIMSLNQRSD